MFFNFEFLFSIYIMFMFLYSYNLALLVLFTPPIGSDKPMYNFSDFEKVCSRPVSLILVIFSLLSMAGIPPFLGFLPKVYLIVLLVQYNFSFWYYFLILLLFGGLYFYLNVVRVLLQKQDPNAPFGTGVGAVNPPRLNSSSSSSLIAFLIFMGFFLCDELFLTIIWLFI